VIRADEIDWDVLGLLPVPEECQEFECRRTVETWCPLCKGFFCAHHDELVPVRRHHCLKGTAEDE